MSMLESSIPKNAIRTISIDTSYDSIFWSSDRILDLILILRLNQIEIKSLAFRHDKWIRSVIEVIRDWTKDSCIEKLVMAIPPAEDQHFPLITHQSGLKCIYLNRSAYTILIDVSFTLLTNVYMSCSSISVNKFAKWLVNLNDLRLKVLWIDVPFNEALQMKKLKYLYIGRTSSVVGDYFVKLIAACPNVSLLYS
jgi:hypothetical protein